MLEFDHIVVGAGIEGAATAAYLAKCGKRTLLLEQFPIPHSRGSSSGVSRQIRSFYACDIYLKMIPDCYKRWKELGDEFNQTLLVPTESLMIGHKSDKEVREMAITAKRNCGDDIEVIQSDEHLSERYPDLAIEKDSIVIRDKNGGILIANKCLMAYIAQFIKNGGTLKDQTTVTQILPALQTVTIRTANNETFRAESVVLCMGPWAGRFIKSQLGLSLPLKPTRATCYYCQVKRPGAYSARLGAPTVNYKLRNGEFYFSWCSHEYADMIKVGLHLSNVDQVDPNARDVGDMLWHRQKVEKFFGEHWKQLDPTIKLVEECIYTWTPDEHFILDCYPAHSNVVIGAGFSGHGFKFAPVVGQILGQLATKQRPSYDLKTFSIKRFNNTQAAKL